MTSRRLTAALVALPAAFALAACASSTTGNGQAAAGDPAAQSSGSPSAAAGSSSATNTGSSPNAGTGSSGATASGAALTKQSLAASLRDGLSKIHSAQLTLAVDAAGQKVTGSGQEKLSGGKLQAMSFAVKVPGASTIAVVLVDAKLYAKLPSALNKSGKPWLLITGNSSNPMVARLGKSLEQTLDSASVSNVGAFVDAAKSVRDDGKQTLDGAPVEKVHVVIDPTKLPASASSLSSAKAAGISEVPLDLYLDNQNRPVQVSTVISAQGQTAKLKISITKYDEPVTITAPPAGQVSR